MERSENEKDAKRQKDVKRQKDGKEMRMKGDFNLAHSRPHVKPRGKGDRVNNHLAVRLYVRFLTKKIVRFLIFVKNY